MTRSISAGMPILGARPAARALRVWLAAISPAAWFLAVAAPVGLFLAFLVPPFQGLDEGNHFLRVFSISGGTLVQPIRDGRAVAAVPACVVEYDQRLWSEGNSPVAFHAGDFWTVPAGCAGRPAPFAPVENTAIYSPVSYLPQTLGVIAARRLGAPLPAVFYAGRLTGLLGFIGLVLLALRLAPRAHAAILAVALTPMALQLGAVYSGDGMTIATALLTVALVLRCRLHPGATWRDFLLAAAAALALGLSKNAYVLLALLLLLVPARLFPSWRSALAARVGAVLAIAVAWATWYWLIRDVSFAPYGPFDAARQLEFVAHHPLSYAKIVAQTLLGTEGSYIVWPGFVSWVGFLRNGAFGSPGPPLPILVLGFVILVLATIRERRGPFVPTCGAVVRAAVPLALLVATAAVVVTALYAENSAVGAPVARGVQGRYFLPLAALPAASLAMLTADRPERRSIIPLLPAILVMQAYLVAKVLTLFY